MQGGTRQQIFFHLRHLTFTRFINAVKLYLGYYYSRLRGKPMQWGMPLSISIEPTTACNLGCPECPSGLGHFTRPTGSLKRDLFSALLKDIGATLHYITFYFQGEPFINPHLLEMVRQASGRGIFCVTSTNAHFISEMTADKIVASGLHKLIISLDGTTQEIYEQYRKKGNIERVLLGTKNILEARSRKKSKFPLVYFQFLVVRPNEHQIQEVQVLANEMGLDGVLYKTAQVYDFENGNPLIPQTEKYARYQLKGDGKWHIKSNLLNQCWKMWHSCVMTWDGRIVPCCFDKDATHQLGLFSQAPFRDIWFGKAYTGFRQSILKSRSEIDICKNCSEGTRVWG